MVVALDLSRPAPAPKRSPDQKRIAQLEKENLKLKKQFQLKDNYLDLQKSKLM